MLRERLIPIQNWGPELGPGMRIESPMRSPVTLIA